MSKSKQADKQWWLAVKDGREPEEWTDDMVRAGAARGIFRQCSIGWHFECSDWSGQHGCKCRCHSVAEKAVARAREKGTIQ